MAPPGTAEPTSLYDDDDDDCMPQYTQSRAALERLISENGDTFDKSIFPPPYNGDWYFPEGQDEGLEEATARDDIVGRPPKPLRGHYHPTLQLGDSFHYRSSLFSPDRDYLVRYDGTKVYASHLQGKFLAILSVFIPVLRHDGTSHICRSLLVSFLQLYQEHPADFEAVLVLRIRPDFAPHDDATHPLSQAAFDHFFSAFPCPAIPLSDPACRQRLYLSLGLSDYYTPVAIVTDPSGKVLVDSYDPLLDYGANLYPFSLDRQAQLHDHCIRQFKDVLLEDILLLDPSHVLYCPCGACNKQVSVSALRHKVVLVYLCRDGSSINQTHLLLAKARQLHDFELVITYNPHHSFPHRPLSQQRLRHLLKANNVCGWLELPFSDKFSRQMSHTFDDPYYTNNLLITIGPYSRFVDPVTMRLLFDFGYLLEESDLYPFTAHRIRDALVESLRALTLRDLLFTAGIHHLAGKDGEIVPLSALESQDVLLYFGYATPSNKFRHEWEAHVLSWYRELQRSNSQFKLVFLCLGVKGATTFEGHCSEMPWLIAPYDKVAAASVSKAILFLDDRFRFYPSSRLVAFGSNGHLRSMQAEKLFVSNCEPVTTFPQDDLLNQVTSLLNRHLEFQLMKERL